MDKATRRFVAIEMARTKHTIAEREESLTAAERAGFNRGYRNRPQRQSLDLPKDFFKALCHSAAAEMGRELVRNNPRAALFAREVALRIVEELDPYIHATEASAAIDILTGDATISWCTPEMNFNRRIPRDDLALEGWVR